MQLYHYTQPHSTTTRLFYFLPRTPSCLPRTTSPQIPVHYSHHFLSEERVGYSARILTPTCRHTRLLIGTRPAFSCTYLQFPRLIPFYCSHASVTGNTPAACVCSATQTQPLRPVVAVLPYMLPRRDECCIKNNVTRIQTDHNKYLHH